MLTVGLDRLNRLKRWHIRRNHKRSYHSTRLFQHRLMRLNMLRVLMIISRMVGVVAIVRTLFVPFERVQDDFVSKSVIIGGCVRRASKVPWPVRWPVCAVTIGFKSTMIQCNAFKIQCFLTFCSKIPFLWIKSKVTLYKNLWFLLKHAEMLNYPEKIQ